MLDTALVPGWMLHPFGSGAGGGGDGGPGTGPGSLNTQNTDTRAGSVGRTYVSESAHHSLGEKIPPYDSEYPEVPPGTASHTNMYSE